MWVAAFTWIFAVNNPHRRYGEFISITGVAASHYYTYVMSRQSLLDVDLGGGALRLQGPYIFQMLLIIGLQVLIRFFFLSMPNLSYEAG
jgi:hypothetical protein